MSFNFKRFWKNTLAHLGQEGHRQGYFKGLSGSTDIGKKGWLTEKMRPCSICAHSQLGDINQDLINGVSVRKIAEKYGVGYRSVYRHKT